MDADYAIIEQISNVVDGDFLGPLQGITSRLKEIFRSKLLGMFVFDLGFKQFVEMAYSLDRNTEKTLVLNEVSINTTVILNNLKKILQGQILKSHDLEIDLENLAVIETYSGDKLSKIFCELLNIQNNYENVLKKIDVKYCHLFPILDHNKEYISVLFMFMENELSKDEKSIWKEYYLRQMDLVVQHLIDIRGLYFRATRDDLTGIYNRNFGLTSLEQYIFLLMRKNLKSLSILFFDIDDFKKVNDTYGHNIGDDVLVKISEIVNQNIRKTDLFLRYGGEEFCVVFPDSDFDVSRLISHRIGLCIKNFVFKSGKKDFSLTLSMGILEYDKEKNYGASKFIEEVDQLMYNAKKAGKNRICHKDNKNKIIINKID
jgi:diguanylate cyclase (GGDEF)-like protein